MKVFLSYARKDLQHIRRFVVAFEDVSGNLFWDRNIEVGQKWAERLSDEIAACDAVLVVWSRNSVGSAEVMKEVDSALAAGKLVVQCKIDGCAIPERLSHENVADLTLWSGLPDHDHWIALLRRLGIEPCERKQGWSELALPDVDQLVADHTRTENVIPVSSASEATKILRRLLRKGYAFRAIHGQSIVLGRSSAAFTGFDDAVRRWLVRILSNEHTDPPREGETVVLEIAGPFSKAGPAKPSGA